MKSQNITRDSVKRNIKRRPQQCNCPAENHETWNKHRCRRKFAEWLILPSCANIVSRPPGLISSRTHHLDKDTQVMTLQPCSKNLHHTARLQTAAQEEPSMRTPYFRVLNVVHWRKRGAEGWSQYMFFVYLSCMFIIPRLSMSWKRKECTNTERNRTMVDVREETKTSEWSEPFPSPPSPSKSREWHHAAGLPAAS